MLYRFAYCLMWVTFKIYFRRIDVLGWEKLQHDEPTLLIANHPASFLDAMVLAVFLRRPVYFYVRGDIFKHPLVYKVFTSLHMIPIFNQGDGVVNLSKNQQTFERGRVILSHRGLLLVFPEGFSRLSKQLATFKKGAARVALQAAFEEPRAVGLHVQVIGINYSSHSLGADLFIRIADRLELSSYKQLYQETPAKAINKLTMDMFVLFQNNVIHIKQGDRTSAVEEIMRMFYSQVQFNSQHFFERSREVCTEISLMSEGDFINYQTLLREYQRQLKMYGLTDQVLVANMSTRTLLLKLLLISPLALIGIFIWWLPGKVSTWIADKTVTREDFYTSVHCGVLGVLGVLWWLLLFLLSLVDAFAPLAILILISPLFAFIAIRWQEKVKLLWSLMRLKQLNAGLISGLMASRKKVLNY